MTRRFRNSRNDAGSLLASTFIVGIAAGIALFICLAFEPASNTTSVAIISSVAVLFLAFIALQRMSGPRAMTMAFMNLLNHNHRDDGLASQYRPRKVKSRPAASSELNQPISVDELREIQATSANTWVPTRNRKS